MAREDIYGLRFRDFKPDTCFTIDRLRVNSQGYLPGKYGQYRGVGAPLFRVHNEDDDTPLTDREADDVREHMLDHARSSRERQEIYETPKERLRRVTNEVEIRARDMKAAKALVREFYPQARFSRGGSCPRK